MDTEVDLIDIPDDETLQKKLYYSISEVAKWFKVNTSLLRYWENEFDVLQPRKTRKGDRLFRVEDIKNLQLIYFLLRQRKFSIEGAKNYLKNNKAQADMQSQLVQSLTKFKSFLLELKANLTAS
jgi:DNA-binding transcriptional MerR regulator